MWCRATRRHFRLRQQQLLAVKLQRSTIDNHKSYSDVHSHNVTANRTSEANSIDTPQLKFAGISPQSLPSNNLRGGDSEQNHEEEFDHKEQANQGKSQDDDGNQHLLLTANPVDCNNVNHPRSHINLQDDTSLDVQESPCTPQSFDTEEIIAQVDKQQQEDRAEYHSTADNAQSDHTTKTYDALLGQNTMLEIIKLLKHLRTLGLPDTLSSARAMQDHAATLPQSHGLSSKRRKSISYKARSSLNQRKNSIKYQRYFVQRKQLPINHPEHAQNIISTIGKMDVVVLVSATGSGKTTQLPQLLMEHQILTTDGTKANILCTQPRRIAAISVARRVADEQNSAVGEQVGYQVRFLQQNPTGYGTISYWTAGILLRVMTDQAEAVLDKYSTIIVDEVHERDITTDLCLALIRDQIRERRISGKPCPKVVLMSATIDTKQFETYFAEPYEGRQLKVATISVPGRNYEVKTHSLDDLAEQFDQHFGDARAAKLIRNSKWYLAQEDGFAKSWCDGSEASHVGRQTHYSNGEVFQDQPLVSGSLISLTIAHIIKTGDSGDILVFLPGMREIQIVSQYLLDKPILGVDFTDQNAIRIFKLHAQLRETNDAVFATVPRGVRRIILATNIAQTSITLPDVVHVVDCGIRRQLIYDYISQVEVFRNGWIDKAASMQRRGRAGRTGPGHYWMMLTEARYESIAEKATPDIQMGNLVSELLLVKSQIGAASVRKFLARVLDPPESGAIASAIEQLQKMDMLDANEEITFLGMFASYLPIAPAKAQGLLFGILFRCLRPLLTFVSHDPDKPLVHHSSSIREGMEASLEFAGITDDDRVAVIKAFDEFDQAHASMSDDDIEALEGRRIQMTAYNDMLNVGRQIYEHLTRYGLTNPPCSSSENVFRHMPRALNQHANSQALITALTLTMTQPKLAVWNEDIGSWYSQDVRCYIRPYSLNSRYAMKVSGRVYDRIHGDLISYDTLLHVSGDPRPMLVETSTVTPLMAIMFGGPVELIENNIILVDGWLRYRINTSIQPDQPDYGQEAAQLIFELRKALDRFLHMTMSSLIDFSQPMEKYDEGKKVKQAKKIIRYDPIRDTFASGLANILEMDQKYWWKASLLAPSQKDGKRKLRE